MDNTKITLRQKILSILIFGITMMSILSFYSFKNFNQSQETFSKLENQDFKLLSSAYDIKYNIAQVQQWLTDISATRAEEGFDDGFSEAKSYSQKVYQNIEDINKIASTFDNNEVKLIATKLKSTFNEFYAKGQIMANTYIKDGHIAGNQYMLEFDSIASSMQSSVDELMKKASTSMKDRITEYDDYINFTKVFMPILELVLIIILIILSLFMIKSINKKLTTSINSLEENNSHIKASSNNLSESAEYLSNIATTQANDIEEITQVVSNSQEILTTNSEYSNKAYEYAKETQEFANSGYKKIKNLLDSINNIQTSSAKISNVVNTINEIAFQTNLLALNAAVEAARAGEHGLGFAVVAEEVRSLASNSAKEAKEITNIISDTVTEIENSNLQAKDTSENFSHIVSKIENSTSLLDDIQKSYIQEKNSIDSLVISINSIDDNIKKLSSSAEETSSSANELNNQAHISLSVVEDISRMVGIKK
jgi:methyl-accepting chemotaxis protein